MKKCYKCKESKPLSEFYKNKNCKDGLNARCKKCDMLNHRKLRENTAYRNKEKESWHTYYAKNKQELLANHKKYVEGIKNTVFTDIPDTLNCTICKQDKPNGEFPSNTNVKYHLDTLCSACKQAKDNTPERRKARNKKYATDIGFAIGICVTSLINQCLRNMPKSRRKNRRHWEDLVGYTIEELMAHLESKFLPGMSWDNRSEWHIDHIAPRSSFDITSAECDPFQKCWSLNNLQPLWARDNISKGSHFDSSFQA